jgi:hypothetical protein
MLVKIKNIALFYKWMNFFDTYHPEMPGYAKRTHSFINSEKGISPAW